MCSLLHLAVFMEAVEGHSSNLCYCTSQSYFRAALHTQEQAVDIVNDLHYIGNADYGSAGAEVCNS